MRAAAIGLTLSYLVFNGCGSVPPQTSSGEPPARAVARPEPPPAAQPADGAIERELLLAVLDRGLGRFLQGVETQPATQDGGFVGFRLLSFYPEDPRFEGLAVRAGDVITRVNGQPIERPEQALRVWEGLRVASELVIEYHRDGEPLVVRYPIEGAE